MLCRDDRIEPQQRDAYLQQIRDHLPKGRSRNLCLEAWDARGEVCHECHAVHAIHITSRSACPEAGSEQSIVNCRHSACNLRVQHFPSQVAKMS